MKEGHIFLTSLRFHEPIPSPNLVRNTGWLLPLATLSIRQSHTNFQFLCFYFLVGRCMVIDVISKLQSCFQYGSEKAENLWGKKSQEKEHALEDNTFDIKVSSFSTEPLRPSSSFAEHVNTSQKSDYCSLITQRLYADSTHPQRRCRVPSGQHTITQYQLKNSPNMTSVLWETIHGAGTSLLSRPDR
ncbi:hypothetical protein PoB_000272200 [Plakobranchus ocellatus]|uniref:Uncharacterized protein n=1 Tax=Plakobranchus ocellatus TaxID=259542 RepID=A0AAV3Y0C4_9GAST|nr:hypothetical protein PoB_000272200 [Plakobranchus ocellatus]